MVTRSSHLRIWTLVGISLVSQVLLAQRTGGAGNTSSRGSVPSRTPITPDLSTQPVFISGHVLMSDGGKVPEPVAIERVCNGVARREGYTDFKGQFQLQLGANMGFQDASENDARATPGQIARPIGQSGNRGAINLTGCEFRAVLAGYQSTSVILRSTFDAFQLELGPIVLKRMGDVKGTTVSLTTMAAPKGAQHAFEKGKKAVAENKIQDAEKELNKAVHEYPQFAAAWSLLGDLHQQENHLDQASLEYGKALAADPLYVNPAYGLALIAVQEKKWQDAAQYSAQVISLNAYAYPAAFFYNAVANYNLGKYDAAEEPARKFKSLDTAHNHPEVALLLSNVLVRKQDYAGAAQMVREYLAQVPSAPNAEQLKAQAKAYDDLSVAKK